MINLFKDINSHKNFINQLIIYFNYNEIAFSDNMDIIMKYILIISNSP